MWIPGRADPGAAIPIDPPTNVLTHPTPVSGTCMKYLRQMAPNAYKAHAVNMVAMLAQILIIAMVMSPLGASEVRVYMYSEDV